MCPGLWVYLTRLKNLRVEFYLFIFNLRLWWVGFLFYYSLVCGTHAFRPPKEFTLSAFVFLDIFLLSSCPAFLDSIAMVFDSFATLWRQCLSEDSISGMKLLPLKGWRLVHSLSPHSGRSRYPVNPCRCHTVSGRPLGFRKGFWEYHIDVHQPIGTFVKFKAGGSLEGHGPNGDFVKMSETG